MEFDSIPSIGQELKSKVYVLAVDDLLPNLISLEEVLNSDELEVVCANSGPEALRKILKTEFCCILLDIRMPGMDGFEVAQIIRADPVFAQTPIIFVTAEAKDQEELFQGYESGAVDFIIKPLSPQVLRAKVRVFADLYRQKKALDKSQLIENLYKQLKDSNDQLKQYTTIASHDMREPLRRIHCLVDLLRLEADGLANAEIDDICEDLMRCTTEGLALVDDFRELTRIVNANCELAKVDLRGIVLKLLADRQEEIEKRGIQVKIETYPQLLCNAELCEELLKALIDNALVHTGSKAIDITFSAENASGEWVMSVLNSGSTIDSAKTEAIFQPFTRLATYQKWQHLGLGLTKARKIVERHHGRIWVETFPSGVSFRFTLTGKKDDKVTK
ncbi:MAG: response regulator [Oligoflexus sp.]|nr:response regulator [Oligoflexus sp.]